jgi:signal transduction histidine kinase
MKIKNKIILLFTLVVTALLLIICASVYYFSSLNRTIEFKERLRNRAITTTELLCKVKGINKELLQSIDQNMLVALRNKSVVVYNMAGQIAYSYSDTGNTPVTISKDLLNATFNLEKEEYYTQNQKEVLVIPVSYGTNHFVVAAAAYDKDGHNELEKLRYVLVLNFIFGSLISFFIGIFFSMRLVVPIKKITQEVKTISSKNFSTRIDTQKPKDELNELAVTLNELLNRLQDSFEIQGRFISNASHELSTPLTSILSQLEITLQNERGNDEYKTVLYSVYDDVRNLTQLTRSLLEIAKASGTAMGLELSLVRMDELLMNLSAEIKKIDPQYIMELQFDNFPEEDNLLLIYGNNDLLYSAIKNIVVNACKYSQNHTAYVQLNFTAKQLIVIVEDDGIGIRNEEKDLIFQPFYRSTNVSYKQGGFGLGLSLAHRIIKLHKGNIELESKPIKGSIFRVSFPIAQ